MLPAIQTRAESRSTSRTRIAGKLRSPRCRFGQRPRCGLTRLGQCLDREAPPQRDLIGRQRPRHERRTHRQHHVEGRIMIHHSGLAQHPEQQPHRRTTQVQRRNARCRRLVAARRREHEAAHMLSHHVAKRRDARASLDELQEAEHQLEQTPLSLLAQPRRAPQRSRQRPEIGPQQLTRTHGANERALQPSRARDARRTIHHVGTSHQVPARPRGVSAPPGPTLACHLTMTRLPKGPCQCQDVDVVPEQLVNLSDIGRLLGVSRQRAAQLAARDDFPEPAGMMGRGKVWRHRDVEKWARGMGRL